MGQLLSFSRALSASRWSLLRNTEHRHGFLHRLDVPCSGLILVAKTYEAYYDLRVQLAAGGISREYVVLCHGWVPPPLQVITARVCTREALPTSAGQQGKPSRTQLKLSAHLTYQQIVVSLVV